ncbi:nuclear transport factor 2 family protein [Nibribacter ruber]|uniref:Nuclear transport factor 2 family protein n=1 Tax=Nibribacter ruber TaxID=2698458 RepID=A0A6P1P133_9BACT|nr:nuclear transport factor 2 family protein [Nibribacter ruber]QHL88415.1 nuclear transport factor 2 family protein [Nibribacter ruber]
MDTHQREYIIHQYIEGYNQFDVAKMVAHFDESIVFENVSGGEVNLSLQGIEAFKQQAEQATAYFSSRKQTPISFQHQANQTEVTLDYHAILAMDFPTGQKIGDELALQGKSVFTFSGDKVIKLVDIS